MLSCKTGSSDNLFKGTLFFYKKYVKRVKRASLEDRLPPVKHVFQLPTLVFLMCAPSSTMKRRMQFSQAYRVRDPHSVCIVTLTVCVL